MVLRGKLIIPSLKPIVRHIIWPYNVIYILMMLLPTFSDAASQSRGLNCVKLQDKKMTDNDFVKTDFLPSENKVFAILTSVLFTQK